MNQPFAIAEDGQVLIKKSEILESQMIVSPIGVSLPDDFAEKAQEKADLLERRLRRIELALGIDATPESTAALEAALSSFSSAIRPDAA